ncbi:V-type ATP synthase subunit C [Picrophilus oshimae]|uniref:A-type ATP synthase subunit C n=1 Tax=Picrophilus torridus (strain ATCC 700027 / DSM 9790 / JCM 10055 / NBRC 100828 / KAW 2/3) TaxID=1122961 RepID=Q6L1S5_PICTO|nr:V-type ATP synthase subunit C [Picrophilus oshimae]AAT43077.1 A1AO H+ ATPase subunit C [Picrophilus oshimae DSM 9789]
MNTVYSGSYGRLKVNYSEFLGRDFIESLIDLDINEIKNRLYLTSYRGDIERSSNIKDMETMLISAINRRTMRHYNNALFAVPPGIKTFIRSYAAKWDVENIKIILSAKYMKYDVKYTDEFLISFRDIPFGIFAGNLKNEDFKAIMSKSDVEAVINYLVNYGYNYLLKYMENYKKTGDISQILYALDYNYYKNLIESARFFNGDEGNIINYIREIIDARNIMIILKAARSNMEFSRISSSIIDLGNFNSNYLMDLLRSKNIKEIMEAFNKYDIEAGVRAYESNGTLSQYELILKRNIINSYIEKMLVNTFGAFIMAYLLTADRERENLRTIVSGKVYNLDKNTIKGLLI